jgi:hypothetical protein
VDSRLLNRVPIEVVDESSAESNQLRTISEANARYRVGMNRVSIEIIRNHPFGDACIPKAFFSERGMSEGHSHNLVLEQFRSRGWVWGLTHLGLWILAALAFFRRRDVFASGLLAACAAVFVCGLVDHPWFVLNQAIVLGAVLVEGVVSYFRRAPKEIHER